MKKKLFGLTIASIAMITSCQKECVEKPATAPNEAAAHTNKISTNAPVSEEDIAWNSFETKNYNGNIRTVEGVPGNGGGEPALDIIIVEWDEWGRAKKNCRGAGLCNATWFPELRTIAAPGTGNNGGGRPDLMHHAVPVKFDKEKRTYYIDILANHPMKSPMAAELETLPIDEDIVLSTKEVLGLDLVMKAGVYKFDPRLDEFGGFRINLN